MVQSANNIDRKNKVVTTEWIVNPHDKTEIFISNTHTDLYKKTNYTPSYYSVLKDGTVVFVYTNVESLIVRETDDPQRA